MTYTYAILEVTITVYAEIYAALIAAGYADQITEAGVIDMHGIGLQMKTTSDDDRTNV